MKTGTVILVGALSIVMCAGCASTLREEMRKEEKLNSIKTKIMAILDKKGGERYNPYDVRGLIEIKKEIYSMGNEVVPVLLEILAELDDGRDGYLIIPVLIGEGPFSFKGDARIVPGLIKIVQNGSHNGRIWAVDTLGRLKVKEVVDVLIKALEDDDKGLQDSAVRALGEIGDKKAEAPLLKMIRDGKGIAALGKISDDDTLISNLLPLYRKSGNPHMVTRTDRGLTRQVDRNKHIRMSIIDVLAKINRPEMVDFFVKELETEKDSYVKGKIFDALIGYSHSEDEALKSRAMEALKFLKRIK